MSQKLSGYRPGFRNFWPRF